LVRLVGDNERAADLLQDTFVRALAALDLAAPPDDVHAVDPRTQQELWRATLPPGFTALDENVATSPDGRWLYVVVFQHDEANPPSLPVEVSSVAKMLLVIDATTGQVQSQPIALPESIQLPHLMTPGSGTTVYLFDRQLYPFNTATQQLEQSIPVPASWPRAALINAVFPSRDGRQLYVLGDTHRVAIFDIEQQVYVAERVLAAPSYVGHGGVWAASSPNGTYIVVASNFKPPTARWSADWGRQYAQRVDGVRCGNVAAGAPRAIGARSV